MGANEGAQLAPLFGKKAHLRLILEANILV